jgi:hypothetical protein
MPTDPLNNLRVYYQRYKDRPDEQPAIQPKDLYDMIQAATNNQESLAEAEDFDSVMAWAHHALSLFGDPHFDADLTTSPFDDQIPSFDDTDYDTVDGFAPLVIDDDTNPYGLVDEDFPHDPETPSLIDSFLDTADASRPRLPTDVAESVAEVDAPTPDNWALFSPKLDPDRLQELMAQLNHWYNSHFIYFKFPLPTCTLQHQGPLLTLYSVYAAYSIANATAEQGSAQAYINYNSIVAQAYGLLVMPNGPYSAELQACLNAKHHIAPRQPEELTFDETVTLTPGRITADETVTPTSSDETVTRTSSPNLTL